MSLLTMDDSSVNDSSTRHLLFFGGNLADSGSLFHGEVCHANFEGTAVMHVYTCITSKVPFTVYFTFKASQILHHQKSPSSWLFTITQPETNHSLGRLANFTWVLLGLQLCSSFAHSAILQETHKPTFTQAESKANNVHPGWLQYVF